MRTCCFIGFCGYVLHKKLRPHILANVQKLITDENVNTFIFYNDIDGLQFDEMCVECVKYSQLKFKEKDVNIIYIPRSYATDDESIPEIMVAEIKQVLSQADFCILYINPNLTLGQFIYNYAQKKGTTLINTWSEEYE